MEQLFSVIRYFDSGFSKDVDEYRHPLRHLYDLVQVFHKGSMVKLIGCHNGTDIGEQSACENATRHNNENNVGGFAGTGRRDCSPCC